MNAQYFAWREIFDDEFAAELKPCGSLPAQTLQQKSIAADNACAERLLKTYANGDLRRGTEKAVPVHHELLSGHHLYRHNVAGDFGSESNFARHTVSAVFSHENAAAACHALENSKQSSAATHLSVRRHLNGSCHPRELAALRKYAFVGVELYFQHRHCGALKFGLHRKPPVMQQCT